jgi:hypothetical protein
MLELINNIVPFIGARRSENKKAKANVTESSSDFDCETYLKLFQHEEVHDFMREFTVNSMMFRGFVE